MVIQNNFLTNGKGLLLALDQGLEHGPADFNIKTIDPDYILNIGVKGKFNAIILQKGLAEKYYENYKSKIPLILKLNGKTNLQSVDNPFAVQICSVKKAVELGASAVGYTIYDGSLQEPRMFSEFSHIQEEAHEYGLPVIVWAYPRGPHVNDLNSDIMAHAARMALELGADMIKIKYNNDYEGFKWTLQCAGKSKVFVSGGNKKEPPLLLKECEEIIKAGASGMAIGRNVWQSNQPLEITQALKSIIFEGKTAKQASSYLK